MDAASLLLTALVSFMVGLGGGYSLLEKRLSQQEQNNQVRLHQQREELERSYHDRLQSRLEALKSQYETQIQQLKTRPAASSLSSTQISPNQVSPNRISIASTPAIQETRGLAVTATPVAISQPLGGFSPGLRSSLSPLQLIQQANHPDPEIRTQLTTELGQCLGSQTGSIASQMIACLGKLSQDPIPQVRRLAIAALAQTQSSKVLPFLRRSLRDADSDVVKTASSAIAQFRNYSKSAPPSFKKGNK
jgi:hypothetical protein